MRIKIKVFAFSGLLLFFFGLGGTAKAATFSVRPALENYSVGQEFIAAVYISSSDQAANAISGTLSFPADKLQVLSVSKTGSIVNMWVQEPAFSNANGSVTFGGVVLNPGFTGSSANVISVRFRAKAFGLAQVSFSSASILANDGLGTNILTGFSGANFNLSGVGTAPPVVTNPSISSDAPAAPQISSPTYPDPNKWYSATDGKFDWSPLTEGITSARILISKIPNAIPTVVYSPAISSKDVTGLEDGVWYIHVQLKNQYGWGSISHFRFQVDSHPPNPFTVIFLSGATSTDPRPIVYFEAKDDTSGIDYYQIKIGDGDFFRVDPSAMKGSTLTLDTQAPGKRTILVQAVDRAGNITTVAKEFSIISIDPPKFTLYPTDLKTSELIELSGATYSNATVAIFIKDTNGNAEKYLTRSDSSGNFSLVWPTKLGSGVYTLYAQVTDARGAVSVESTSVNFRIRPNFGLQIGDLIINNPWMVGLLLFLELTLLFGGAYGWHAAWKSRRKRHSRHYNT